MAATKDRPRGNATARHATINLFDELGARGPRREQREERDAEGARWNGRSGATQQSTRQGSQTSDTQQHTHPSGLRGRGRWEMWRWKSTRRRTKRRRGAPRDPRRRIGRTPPSPFPWRRRRRSRRLFLSSSLGHDWINPGCRQTNINMVIKSTLRLFIRALTSAAHCRNS